MGLGLGLGSCSGALSRARTAPAVSSAAGEGDLQRPVALDHKLRLARELTELIYEQYKQEK